MTEDKKAISQVSEIAALDGVDLVALGPTDLSQTLGVSGPSDPKLKSEVERIASEVEEVGNAKLQMPYESSSFSFNGAGARSTWRGIYQCSTAATCHLDERNAKSGSKCSRCFGEK